MADVVTTEAAARAQTLEDWLRIPEEARAELLFGRIVYQGMPGPRHGRLQARVAASLSDPFDRRRGSGDLPGGWWLTLEVDLSLAGHGVRPDLVGWRRERAPTLPEADARGVVTVVPDWVCEVLSRSTAHIDQGSKRVAYHAAGVGHYWLVDPESRLLTVLEREERGYLVLLVAGPGETVRAPPFHEIELSVGDWFAED